MPRRPMPGHLRTVASGLKYPEGPLALPDGSVLVMEVWGGNVARISPQGDYGVVAYMGGRPCGAAIGPDGRCYVCNDGGRNERETAELGPAPDDAVITPGGGSIQVVDLASGVFETLYTEAGGWPIGAANDIVFDAHGGFYFTDFARQNRRMSTRGRVCYAMPDGSEANDVVAPIDTANGVGLSPDGKTLYVAQAAHGRLLAFDILEPGRVRDGDRPGGGAQVLCTVPGPQGFDSLGVDADGYICVATTRSGQITVVAPDGSGWTQVDVADAHVTNICWGGPGLRTAYVTLGAFGVLAAMDWERPGLGLHFLNR